MFRHWEHPWNISQWPKMCCQLFHTQANSLESSCLHSVSDRAPYTSSGFRSDQAYWLLCHSFSSVFVVGSFTSQNVSGRAFWSPPSLLKQVKKPLDERWHPHTWRKKEHPWLKARGTPKEQVLLCFPLVYYLHSSYPIVLSHFSQFPTLHQT